jgi:hypothetical protein
MTLSCSCGGDLRRQHEKFRDAKMAPSQSIQPHPDRSSLAIAGPLTASSHAL